MFLKKTLVFVIVIVVGVSLYIFYENIFTTVYYKNISIFTTVYYDSGIVRQEVIENAMFFQHMEGYLVVPINGYAITNPTVFFDIILHRSYELTFAHLPHGLAHALIVDNVQYTVHPHLAAILIYTI